MSTKKKQVGSTNDVRATLEEAVAAFLKKGNEIEEIPSGVSGQVFASGKKPAPAVADKKTT